MPEGYHGRRTDPAQKGKTIWLFSVTALLALAAAAVFFFQGPDRGVQAFAAGQPGGSGAGSSAPPAQDADPAQSAPQAPDIISEPASPPYDFSQPVPESDEVDNSYFADAAFIGDSRTDGFMIYSGIGTGDNLTSNGLSIFKLAEKKALTIGGEQYTLLEALALKEYGKVYLSLGVNELGYHNDDGFYRSYCAAIDEIRRVQPNAVIYIQNLIPVNEAQSVESTGHDYLTNDHLRVYNDLLRQAAEEKQVVYLDLYSQFADENGSLPEDASRDGVHLKKPQCQQWLAYLKTHTVEFDALYPDGPPTVEPAQPETTTADGSGQG